MCDNIKLEYNKVKVILNAFVPGDNPAHAELRKLAGLDKPMGEPLASSGTLPINTSGIE